MSDATAARIATLEFLLRDRLENYGYDRSSWNTLRSTRQRAKRWVNEIVAKKGVNALDWGSATSNGRLTVSITPAYVVGQSSNEEFTGLLRTLAGRSFWPNTPEQTRRIRKEICDRGL